MAVLLTRAAFEAAAKKAPIVTMVDVPALGGQVGVLQLRGRQLDAFFDWCNRQQAAETRKAKLEGRRAKRLTVRSRLLVRTLVTGPTDPERPDPERLFADEDVALLDEIPALSLKPLIEQAMQLNNLSDKDLTDDDPALEDEPEPVAAPSA